MMMAQEEELLATILVELKRGTITLVVLSQLTSPQYGYSLLQLLEEKHAGIEAGTLYPLLRRLEKQGLLVSEWDTTETRPRKYYQMSLMGKRIYHQLKLEWKNVVNQMAQFI